MKSFLKSFATVLICIGLISIIFSCKKEKSDPSDDIQIATVTTAVPSSVAFTTAVSGGNIISDGGGAITASGVCWSTSISPTISNNKTNDGATSGSYISNLTGLTTNTLYNLRAYATNSKGTGYGEQIQFITLIDYTGQTGTVTDIDGNTYPTIGIGNQIWMAANLRSTKYRNGVLIGTTAPATLDISAEASPKYQWAYAGNENNVSTYGRLYSWHTVTDSRFICPTGWHVPSDAEWTTLTTFIGGDAIAGAKLKEAGITHWTTPNTGATNLTGFTALPGGDRETSGTFKFIYENGGFWSSTENTSASGTGWFRFLFYDSGIVSRGYFSKSYGYSVRCVKDILMFQPF
jgi:uncharacterized protein (TIGR02145 family)